jgi:hypothetical protein
MAHQFSAIKDVEFSRSSGALGGVATDVLISRKAMLPERADGVDKAARKEGFQIADMRETLLLNRTCADAQSVLDWAVVLTGSSTLDLLGPCIVLGNGTLLQPESMRYENMQWDPFPRGEQGRHVLSLYRPENMLRILESADELHVDDARLAALLRDKRKWVEFSEDEKAAVKETFWGQRLDTFRAWAIPGSESVCIQFMKYPYTITNEQERKVIVRADNHLEGHILLVESSAVQEFDALSAPPADTALRE